MFSGYIKDLLYPPELSKMAIELMMRCLSMNSEKRMIIDESFFRWTDLSFFS
jgi:hypothetical protein